MTAHKHVEMIKAKADNMDLVVLSQNQKDLTWYQQNDQGTTDFGEFVKYFLCLPQHKEACLHWLNGGEVEFEDDGKWHSCSDWSKVWSLTSGFTSSINILRIKPKTEKRWIATFPWCGVDNYVIPEHHANEDELGEFIHKTYGSRPYQAIEIEVDV